MVPGILVNMVILGDLEYSERSLCCIQYTPSCSLWQEVLVSNEKGHRNKGVPEILPGAISAWKDRQGPSGHEKQALLFPLRCLYQWCLGKHLSPLIR